MNTDSVRRFIQVFILPFTSRATFQVLDNLSASCAPPNNACSRAQINFSQTINSTIKISSRKFLGKTA